MFASGAVVIALALAAPALASANSTHASDPKDVHGALDIAGVTGAHVGSNIVHTLRTYKPFRSQLLKQRNTYIAFAFDTDLNGKLDAFAVIGWVGGKLRGALLDSGGEPMDTNLQVTRPDSRTVKLTIPSRLIGSPARYRWIATAEYQGLPGCKKPCFDYAPDRGTITQQLKPLASPLAVHIIGPGRVYSNPHGIACPGTCVYKFGRGDTVWLSPAPIGTNVFTGWSGACTGTGVCKVTAGAALSVIANFAPTYALTIVTVAPGTVQVTPPGVTCTSAQICTQRYAMRTTVTLTAQAPAGYVFTGWAGSCTGTTPTCTLTMDADATVTAVFGVQPVAGLGVERISPNDLLWSGNERARLEPW